MMITNTRCGIAILCSWLAGIVLWVFPLAGVGSFKYNAKEAVCVFNLDEDPQQWIGYMVIIFLPSSIIIIICYASIWKVSMSSLPL